MGFGERRRQAVRWVIGCDLFKSSIYLLSLLDGEEKEEASYNSEGEMFSGSRYNGASATPEYGRSILTSGLWTDACSSSPFVWAMSEKWGTVRSGFFQMHDLNAVVAMADHLFKWFNIFPSQQMWMIAFSGVKCSLITDFHAIWALHDVSL